MKGIGEQAHENPPHKTDREGRGVARFRVEPAPERIRARAMLRPGRPACVPSGDGFANPVDELNHAPGQSLPVPSCGAPIPLLRTSIRYLWITRRAMNIPTTETPGYRSRRTLCAALK